MSSGMAEAEFTLSTGPAKFCSGGLCRPVNTIALLRTVSCDDSGHSSPAQFPQASGCRSP